MGERYGKCRTCGGHGKLLVCPESKDKYMIPCYGCAGEGFSGDAFEHPQYKADWDTYVQSDSNFFWESR